MQKKNKTEGKLRKEEKMQKRMTKGQDYASRNCWTWFNNPLIIIIIIIFKEGATLINSDDFQEVPRIKYLKNLYKKISEKNIKPVLLKTRTLKLKELYTMLQTLTFLPILGVQLVFLDRNALSALTRRQVHIVKRLLDQRVFTHQAACTVMNLIPDKHSDIILGSSNVSNSEVSESGSGGESTESDSNNICE